VPDASDPVGGPALTPGASIGALEEAVAIIRAFWSGEPGLRFDGRHYELRGLKPGPLPAHPISIWLGAAKPRGLAPTGRVADGWVAPLMNYMPPTETRLAQELIDSAAREAGRDPRAIRRIALVPGAFAAAAPAPATDSDQAIVGPPEHWADVLTDLALDLGFGSFNLVGPPDAGTPKIFIDEVAPDVQERVGAGRAHMLAAAEERPA
jgi:hypothetical protein